MGLCAKVRDFLERMGYEITYYGDGEDRCVLNFRDARLFKRARERFGEDVAEYISTSSISVDEQGRIEANLVSPLFKFCELYLTGCCSEDTNLCRVHIDPKYARVGLEIRGADLDHFKEALKDFLNCTRT